MSVERNEVVAATTLALEPPPLYTVSQWADAERKLPATSNARGGPWRTADVPYLRAIMDSVHEPGARFITLMKCVQSGGSEALHNIVGYHVKYDPCAMLFVHPTIGQAEEWSKERLADMIRSTPALSAVIQDKRKERGSHDAESTLGLKVFPGGYLAIGGANTPNTFARRSVRIGMADDFDRFPPVVGEEGDPADLLVNRTTTFHDALVIFVSTPTLKNGRIDLLYQRSDQRRYFVQCLGCMRWDWITWNDPNHFRVVFDDVDAESARVECPDEEHGGCGARLYEPERRMMVDRGEWRPTATPKEPGHIGFHLPQMIATLGNVSLPNLVDKWLAARAKGKESLRVFINTALAEGWEDRGARMEPHVLMSRREEYGEPEIEVPGWAAALTAGIDTQDDRFELLVTAWGPAMERAVVDWRTIPGSPKLPETRAALLDALSRRYRHALGVDLPIHASCIDSAGHHTNEVYDFVLAYQARRIFATVGRSGKSGEPIVSKPSEKRYGRSPRPVRLYTVNVDDAKADVVNSLALSQPGPGYMHFPVNVETVNEEFFAQLCAEHRETRYNKAGVATHTVWVQHRERNEALDCAVLCLAAHRLLNPNIRQMLEALANAAREMRPPDSTPPAGSIPQPPRQQPPRVARSSYLGR